MIKGDESTVHYKVIVNHEGQYCIWPAASKVPLGWTDVGKTGIKSECLSYIRGVWIDMTPLSLRKRSQEKDSSVQQPMPVDEWSH
jgi:MbtH protein